MLRRDAIALEVTQMWHCSALRHAKRLHLDDAADLAMQQQIGVRAWPRASTL